MLGFNAISEVAIAQLPGAFVPLSGVNGRHTSIPTDPNNTDYAEILKQVKEGTLTIKDAD